MNLDLLFEASAWASLLTLTAMEIVLGIDNIVFISVLVSRLPAVEARRARQIGLALALVFRILLLLILSWLIGLTEPVVTIFGKGLSWRDLILLAGGLFLIYKATHEIHQGVEGGHHDTASAVKASFTAIVAQIIVIDMVFSVDSIITAVGMTDEIAIMVIAVVSAVTVMLLAADPLSRFIAANPTIVMLALGFLLMIGMTLIADGFGYHVPKGYIYAAMGFSALVEALNVLAWRRRQN